MGRKWALGVIGILSVAALAGIGFAQFTSTATITGSASVGTYGPVAYTQIGTSTATPSGSVATCGISGSVYAASGFGAGDTCTISGTLSVGGSLGSASLTESVNVTSVTGCPNYYWYYSDTLFFLIPSNVFPLKPINIGPVGPGYSASDKVSLMLSGSAPSGCQGASPLVTITITGTAV